MLYVLKFSYRRSFRRILKTDKNIKKKLYVWKFMQTFPAFFGQENQLSSTLQMWHSIYHESFSPLNVNL